MRTTIVLATALTTWGLRYGSGGLPSRKPAGVKQTQVENSNIPWF